MESIHQIEFVSRPFKTDGHTGLERDAIIGIVNHRVLDYDIIGAIRVPSISILGRVGVDAVV